MRMAKEERKQKTSIQLSPAVLIMVDEYAAHARKSRSKAIDDLLYVYTPRIKNGKLDHPYPEDRKTIL